MTIAKDIVPDWSEADLAWFSGLFEGEGCLSKQMTTKHGYWVLGITMTDSDVIEKAHRIAQSGTFLGPMMCPSLEGYKPTFRLTVNAQQHIYELTLAMMPHLGQRRNKRIAEFHAEYLEKLKTKGMCRAGLHPMNGSRRCRECTNLWQRQNRSKKD